MDPGICTCTPLAIGFALDLVVEVADPNESRQNEYRHHSTIAVGVTECSDPIGTTRHRGNSRFDDYSFLWFNSVPFTEQTRLYRSFVTNRHRHHNQRSNTSYGARHGGR